MITWLTILTIIVLIGVGCAVGALLRSNANSRLIDMLIDDIARIKQREAQFNAAQATSKEG